MEIVSREAAQQIVDTVKDVCSQNINFIDEKGLSEDTLCRVVIVRLNVRYNPNNLFMIQSAITQAFAQMNCSFYRYNYPNEYILIIEKERLEKNRHILKRLADTYEKVLCIGVGSVSTVMAGAASYDWPATIRVNLPMPSSYTVLCGWKISRNHKNDGQVIKKISQKVLDF